MKSYSYKALAAAAAAVCGTSAFAGSQAVTQRDFALEAITNSTTVTLPNIVTTIGVARTTAQDFTVIVKPVSSSTKFDGACPVPTFANTGAGLGAVTISQKRVSQTECAYEVDVTEAFAGGNGSLTFSGLKFSAHSLASENATESVSVGVWELSENARVDNSADLTNVVAKTQRAVTLTAAKDTDTTADVLFDSGNKPLFGFTGSGDDTTTVAEANFTVSVNGSLTNAGGTAFNANVDLTKVTFTVKGEFDGLKTNFAASDSAVTVGVGGSNTDISAVTVSGTGDSATAVFSANGTAFNATGNTVVNVKLETAATKSLGTARTFGVSAVVDPSLSGAADQNLAGASEWWVWTANAIELRSAFFNNDNSGNNKARFYFQNLGSVASYSTACQAETGVTVTTGAKAKGDLNTGMTMLTADQICTFSAGARGSITFTINSSAGKIKGVYQQVVNGTAATYIPLERPYNNNNPTY